jgi:serine/threonine protein kinase/tetratricopeptide (TPR) repeat protein
VNESLDMSIEPAAEWHLAPEQRDRLTDLLDGYLSQLERGLPPPRENLMQANPDLAEPLRAYFQSLDELHDMAAGFMPQGRLLSDRGATDSIAEADDHARLDNTVDEKRLGDFRLLREVGRGGMGVVYEAEQISLGRRVALKVLPFAAVLDSRQIARFRHEAQSAGQLNHPNIVSVFAVGVERGVHYYAMQFIDGQPLDRVVAEMRERRPAESADRTKPYLPQQSATHKSQLTSRPANSSEYIRGVVGIGIDAARALHAAHENGVVHRDVKPSNLLLDGNGKIWVTDFGLARRASDATLTRTGDLLGTMRYMSPEQATGQMALVDHRTDIYSLGATLYELLTLEAAMSGHEGQALLRQIERHDPRPPRQLQPKVPLDLQTVVMKGMAKRRDDRYATANDFADDLQRVLEGKPIVARPPALLDRAARFAQRHREIAAAAAAVCLLALVGLAASTFLILGEKTKTAQNLGFAKERLKQAHDAVDELGRDVYFGLAHVPGAAEVRKDVLRKTLGFYRSFLEQAKDNPGLQAELAQTYNKIGKLYAETGAANDAIDADKKAIRIYKALAEDNPSNTDYPQGAAVCENNLGLALAAANKTSEAQQAYEDAIRTQEGVLGKLENKEQCLTDLALAHNDLGLLRRETGDFQVAAVSLERASAIQEQLLAAAESPERLRNLATTLSNLASLDAERLSKQTIARYEKAAMLQDKALSLQPDDPLYRGELAMIYNNLAQAQRRDQDATAAERSYRLALELQDALVKQDPRDAELKSALGGIYNNLGLALEDLKRPAEAVTCFEQAVGYQRHALTQAPEVARYRLDLDRHYYNYAGILRSTGRVAKALQVALARRNLWPNHPEELFLVAKELALAATDPMVKSGGGATRAEYGERAVETLKLAIAAGWKPKPDSDWMKAFTALKNRDDFLALTF